VQLAGGKPFQPTQTNNFEMLCRGGLASPSPTRRYDKRSSLPEKLLGRALRLSYTTIGICPQMADFNGTLPNLDGNQDAQRSLETVLDNLLGVGFTMRPQRDETSNEANLNRLHESRARRQRDGVDH
jgi:hypothetical protein